MTAYWILLALIAGERHELIGPLMESLTTDLLLRNGDAVHLLVVAVIGNGLDGDAVFDAAVDGAQLEKVVGIEAMPGSKKRLVSVKIISGSGMFTASASHMLTG